MDKPFVCAFTGHRPTKLPFGYNETDSRCLMLKDRLSQEIEKLADDGVKAFITGMAQGVDIWAAEAVLKLKNTTKPQILLHCVLPCEEYNKNWDNKTCNRSNTITHKADKVTCLSQHYFPGCMLLRDKWMVNRADVILAVLNGSMAYSPDRKIGGTAYTVDYAASLRKRIITIDPEILFAIKEEKEEVSSAAKQLLPVGRFVEER